MKAFIFSLALLCAFSYSCSAAEIPDTYADKISSVNFYPGGAKFEFVIEPQDMDENGNFEAYLPGAFTPESVKVLNPESLYGDIFTERLSRTKWIPSQLEDLKSQQEEQSKLIDSLAAQQAALEQTLNLLKNVEPGEKSSPDDILKYFTEAQKLRQQTENDLASLKITLADEKAKLTVMNDDLKSRRPSGDTSYLVITGRAKSAVRLEAFTKAASWSPRYIINLDSTSGDIDVQMFIRASQRTGLDYSGRMTLHTKTPDENISTPVLNPLKVGIKPKVESVTVGSGARYSRTNNMYESVRMKAAAPMMMEDTAMQEFDDDEEDYTSGPAVSETLSDRTINIRGTITGDGHEREYEASLGNAAKLTATPVIMLIPEQRENAWIIASMDEENEKLIPGMAELRVDNYPSGKLFIQEFGAGQKQIPFGYAEQITVKKESLIGKTGVSWFSGVFNSGYKLQITNGTKTDRVITVRDRLPVPIDEKIKLDIKRIEPVQKTKDAENRFTWEITVPAGKTETIIVDYTLSYPSGEELQYR